MSTLRVERVEEPAALWRSVATALLGGCRERQSEGGVPCLVLTGGSGGAGVLDALVSHPQLGSVDWRRVRFLWGDERWVPKGDPDRNDRLADETLFREVAPDPSLVHRMPSSDCGLTLESAAAEYAALIDGIERIDIALSGVGPDGHVASIFPGRHEMVLPESAASVVPVRDSPKPPPERISLTLRTLNRARSSWLLAAGAAKAEPVAAILARTEPMLPAALLRGRDETVLWIDGAAERR